ncbi:MAG: DUF2520 domain-containing protein [Bacteroidota bacterium]|nr:DUF2520 domain-containing protein [Bacteroidota bacterium]
MKVCIIGSGNLAWHLAQALDSNGNRITDVYSRNKQNAHNLCKKLYHAESTSVLNFSESSADLFIVCVSDDAIFSVISQIQIPENKIIVHTSGTLSLDVFKELNKFENYGVFYPVQTFTKSKQISFKNIPICIEANNVQTEKNLEKMAFSICENVCFIDSNDRKILHLAAVFACNFTTQLIQISKNVLEKNALPFDIIKPLIAETIEKTLLIGPEKAITGPAIRNDYNIIESHKKLLEKDKLVLDIYSKITDSIIQTHRNQ